jgi:hypothetical protein
MPIDNVEISVNKVADALTRAAAVAWLLVGLLTLASSAVLPATILINAIGATVFLAVALLLAWKASVLRHLPANRALDPLFRVEAVTGAVMLLLGAALATAASHRLLLEHRPVFG